MGIIWRYTMPLLSTLAALVIIVHSAEEDLEYRQDLRPLILDNGTPISEKPWRVVETEPSVLKSTQSHVWNYDQHEETPRRRRPRRKRKRRPSPSDDLVPEERYVFPEEPPRPYFDLDQSSYVTTDVPKRRRKKIDPRPSEWREEVTEERLSKRRGLRRRRPTSSTWPEFNEYNAGPPEETPVEVVIERDEPLHSEDKIISDKHRNRFVKKDKGEVNDEDFVQEAAVENNEFVPQIEEEKHLDRNKKRDHEPNIEDKFSSEFSYEVVPREIKTRPVDETLSRSGDLRNKSHGVENKNNKETSIDPMTLKRIIKQSNGTSLSEVLQRHNLTLLDLLRGNEKALAILKTESSSEIEQETQTGNKNDETIVNEDAIKNTQDNENSEANSQVSTHESTEIVVENSTAITEANQEEQQLKHEISITTEPQPVTTHRVVTIRRFSPLIRRKLRMRPMLNATIVKNQVNKDLIALNARKYALHRRNFTKTNESKHILPKNTHVPPDPTTEIDHPTTTLASTTEEIPTQQVFTKYENHFINSTNSITQTESTSTEMNIPLNTLFDNQIGSEVIVRVAESPTVTPSYKYSKNSSLARRQSFNNRLKKKRLRQKINTTELPEEDFLKHLFSTSNVSFASEFTTRTQTTNPAVMIEYKEKDIELADFITTRSPKTSSNKMRSTIFSTTTELSPETTESFTEETAKVEIEEILNDTQTSERLSKILMERNMSLNELVAHRERGSSHVHLADIFHNASKEPNPPEPFLSKSLIEPISKETYPLRAILEANSHEATAKTTTVYPNLASNHANIPLVLDFGNNVNENAENMGIMSLFQNLTNADLISKNEQFKKIPEGIKQLNDTGETVREGRILTESKEDNIVNWNQIFTMMRNNYGNQSNEQHLQEETLPAQPSLKPVSEEDVDGDGLIVLEDLQHLRELTGNISPDYQSFSSFERTESSHGGHESMSSQTKSVTVATASIAGLGIVLFLLTYAVFKWKHQKCMNHGNSTVCDQKIPTPVFECRKIQRNSSSTRSVSPMLSSNIYTLNTLDSRNGKESPEYMWDSLRKPFQ